MNLWRKLFRPAVSEEDVLGVIYFYHLDPQPQRALAVFERMVDTEIMDPANYDQMASAAWVFGRIAGMNPEIQEPVRRALERRGAAASPFGTMVLETASAGEEAAKRLLTRPLTLASDIAFLGAEVVATGSLEPFIRMIDAYGLPDVVRMRLEDWLRGESRDPAPPSSIEEGIEVLASDYNIIARADPPSVLTVSDCDLMIQIRKPLSITVQRLGQSPVALDASGQPQPDRREFPVRLSGDDVEPLRIKLSAWTEVSEALNQHAGLVDRVRAEVGRRNDPRVKVSILEQLAAYELPKLRFKEGIALLDQVLEIDPYRPDLERLVEQLRKDPLAVLRGRVL
jgi:hypothetical protein